MGAKVIIYEARVHLPADVGSDPRSEVDLCTSGRGPKVLQRSTVPPPPPPADSPMSMLLLEELMSDPALLNQILQTRTRSVRASYGAACLCARVRWYLRCCFGELCGVLEGVDWVEEASRSSLDSKLWICSFCDATERRSLTNPGFSRPRTSPSHPHAFPCALTWSESGIRWWCLVSSAVRPLWGV